MDLIFRRAEPASGVRGVAPRVNLFENVASILSPSQHEIKFLTSEDAPPADPPRYGFMASAVIWTWQQTAALLAGGIAVAGAVITATITYGLNQRAARRERQANAFAEALQAIEDYAEMPYRIRRRLGTHGARHELTEQISQIQSRIAFHQAWLSLETPEVARDSATGAHVAP